MSEENIENTSEKQATESDDFYVEEGYMMFEEGSLVYEDEFFKIWDDNEGGVLIGIIKRGVTIKVLDYDEMRDLVILEETFGIDANAEIWLFGLEENGYSLYFRENNVNIRFTCFEWGKFKAALQKAGSPHPWVSIPKKKIDQSL
jgi:hypothetical protein